MKSRISLATVSLLALDACSGTAVRPSAEPATVVAPAPIPEPVAAAVLASMDPAVDPCADFYRYSCGGWLEHTDLPADEVRYGRFHVLRDRNHEALRDIMERAAKNPETTGDQPKLGRFWSACMDEDAIESAGLTPLAANLAAIDKVTDQASFMAVVGELHRAGVPALFHFSVEPDFKRPDLNIAALGQGGLGLPDRQYYVGDDAQFTAMREGYGAHVAKMFELLGASPGVARADAQAVVGFETRLAQAAWPREKLREPEQMYNLQSRAEFVERTAGLGWDRYFATAGVTALTELNPAPADYFAALPEVVATTTPATLRAYLRWHLVHSFADDLPQAFARENFAFYDQTLRGQAVMAPRWKRCIAEADGALGELLGRDFVAQQFSSDSRKVALAMIRQIEGAFAANLPKLSWMDGATRDAALGKLHAIVNKIGYPDAWRDYGALTMGEDHVANLKAAARFEFDRRAREIGQPVDRAEWFMSPPSVNAYYNPSGNEMVFPAGILQPPFFERDWPMAMNFGGIGMVMGHELTHGFDDQGRKFDGAGRLRQWWAPQVGERFEARAACVDALYSGFEVQKGVHLSGKLTLGENIADLGGIKAAHRAFLQWAEQEGLDPRQQAAQGLTHEQLFFVSFGQIWCTQTTPETDRVLAVTDPHSHPRYRVNGPLSNLPEFGEAFSCAAGTPMRPADTCEVW